MAIVSVLFISGSFLAFYASRADDQPALKLLRTYALFWSTPTIIAALTAFIFLSQHNERHFQNMMDLWWLLALSRFSCQPYGRCTRTPLRTGFYLCHAAIFLCIFAYGIGQYPYILDPYITIQSGATHESMGVALVAPLSAAYAC